MALPIFKSSDQNLMLMQSSWTSQLNPLLSNPSNNTSILKNVQLISGTNTINHLLGKKLQGYRIIRQRALANIYDAQDSNQSPQLTLVLISDAPVSVDIEVL